MAYDGVGKIYITQEQFWDFIKTLIPCKNAEVMFGVPVFDSSPNGDITIDYAFSTECWPGEWANPPDFIKPKIDNEKEKK